MVGRGGRRRVPAVAALLAMAAACGGCAAPAPVAEPTPQRDLTASVYQPRTDIPLDRIAVTVHNDEDHAVEITSARLRSSVFAADLVWDADRPVDVAAGRAVDLRVALGAPACAEGEPSAIAEIGWRDDEGSGTIQLVAEDEFGLLPFLQKDACVRAVVGVVADIRSDRVEGGGLGTPAELVIAVTPTGDGGTVTVDAVFATTLISPAPAGEALDELPLDRAVSASPPSEIRVPIVANRCDAHTLAEDKVGTRIPLQVTTPDGAGRLVLPASPEVRAQLYAFYLLYCGL